MCSEPTDDEPELLEFFHFGFSGTRLSEDFCDLSEVTIKESLRQLEDVLLSKYPSDDEEIKKQMVALEEIYIAQSQGPLQKFKEAAKEIFALPSNVLWSGHKEDKPVTSQELAELEKEVSDLEEKCRQAICDQAYLQKELETFERVEPLYKRVEEIVQFSKSVKLRPGEKTTEELLEAQKTLESLYFKHKSAEKSSTGVADVYNLVQM